MICFTLKFSWKKYIPKILAAGLATGLLCYVQSQSALAAVPQDAPKDVKYLLGLYYGNGENILIREQDGRLEMLYRFEMKDKSFAGSNIYPLTKQHFDSYLMHEVGPMSSTAETDVRFERDSDGYGIACRVGGHTYSRAFFGQTMGERAVPYRFETYSEEDWAKLRQQAAEAVMPAALAEGTAAELVDAATLAGVKIDSVYATADNLFGAALYTTPKLYLSTEAAAALALVEQDLERDGYGLVLWDAYRPWSVSKLANLALPADKKDLLADPETEENPHNTGHAVDVGLYNLETGETVELTSGFDEPSPRQYASYAGGTSMQRYLRTMLQHSMERHGFKKIEMEWWHFEYITTEKAAHLNTVVN